MSKSSIKFINYYMTSFIIQYKTCKAYISYYNLTIAILNLPTFKKSYILDILLHKSIFEKTNG